MILRRRAFDNRTVSAVVGTKVVHGMHHGCRLFEGGGNLWAAQGLLRPQDYECGTVDYW